MRRFSSRWPVLLFLALLAIPLTAASSCNRKAGTSAAQQTTTPGTSVYTPRPVPPTITLRPGEPTRMPALPG